MLYVKGRTSGEWRTTPVNPLRLADGTRYLVAPRGNTQWVRNLRAAGGGELRIGRKVEPFTRHRGRRRRQARDPARLPQEVEVRGRRVLRRRGRLKAPEEKLREIAPGYPIFRIEPDAVTPLGRAS